MRHSVDTSVEWYPKHQTVSKQFTPSSYRGCMIALTNPARKHRIFQLSATSLGLTLALYRKAKEKTIAIANNSTWAVAQEPVPKRHFCNIPFHHLDPNHWAIEQETKGILEAKSRGINPTSHIHFKRQMGLFCAATLFLPLLRWSVINL